MERLAILLRPMKGAKTMVPVKPKKAAAKGTAKVKAKAAPKNKKGKNAKEDVAGDDDDLENQAPNGGCKRSRVEFEGEDAATMEAAVFLDDLVAAIEYCLKNVPVAHRKQDVISKAYALGLEFGLSGVCRVPKTEKEIEADRKKQEKAEKTLEQKNKDKDKEQPAANIPNDEETSAAALAHKLVTKDIVLV